MTTKIILHGGNSSRPTDNNEKFFKEIISSVDKDNIIILCIYFARPARRWEESYAEDQSIFFARAIEMGKDVTTKLATYDLDELREDMHSADVIFINGGIKGHLKSTLEELGNFRELASGKVLVGISAGANILCKYYYSSVSEGIKEGMGILQLKILTHYNDEEIDKEIILLLENYRESVPMLKIPEEEYKIIELTG
jgi:peptidase E